MPIVCSLLSQDVLAAINVTAPTAPTEEIVVTTEGDAVVFESPSGFYFRRLEGSLEETIRKELGGKREYLCNAFEITDKEAIPKLVERIQERHGMKYFRMMEYLTIDHKGRLLFLLKMPSCVVRDLMAPMGGTLKTGFSGPVVNLRQIPTLVELAQIPEEDASASASSIFVTEYAMDQYAFAARLHYNVVREVIARPNMGIAICPLAIWDA